jgi:hypothetical protein
MPLPTSGELTLQDIENEFGGSGAIGLSEYYAGGGLVPFGTEGIYGPIPTSGTIDIRDFYGAPFSAPEPVINFAIECGQGDDDYDTYGERAYVFGYSRVTNASNPGSLYGDIDSGDPVSDDGWGISSVALIETYDGPPRSHGFIINWTNANFLNDRFRFDIDDGDIPFTLDTRDADVDTWFQSTGPGGNKNVRTCFWDFTAGSGYLPWWDTGEINSIRAENLSA